MIWVDVADVLLMLALAVLLTRFGFGYLIGQDMRENQRNREDACLSHAWTRVADTGLVCQLCGKVPGG